MKLGCETSRASIIAKRSKVNGGMTQRVLGLSDLGIRPKGP
jgi:hypothetical protein